MANVLLIVQLILALALIGVVLMQRSEGGGLGMGGGGGGGGGMMSGRSAATALSKVTWALGAAFFAVCIVLTIIAAEGDGTGSVLTGVGAAPETERPGLPADLQGDLLPPALTDSDIDLPPPAE